MTPDDFARAFAVAFGAQDADRLAGFLAEDAGVLTLTGGWAEGRPAAKLAFQAEFSGIFAHARLVTGKGKRRELAPGVVFVQQRFVVSGAKGANGADLPRFAAMLTAVLVSGVEDWQAATLSVSGLAE